MCIHICICRHKDIHIHVHKYIRISFDQHCSAVVSRRSSHVCCKPSVNLCEYYREKI